ncbi:MAG: hypothetical protein M3Q29_18390 [Chloroflexota bacterium]|nr:hypothetical protein [Chloroflexota bacterium]
MTVEKCKRVARVSGWAIIGMLLVVEVVGLITTVDDTYQPMQELVLLMLVVGLLLLPLHQLCFKSEWDEMRRRWVQRHPWLKHWVWIEEDSRSGRTFRSVSIWFTVLLVTITLWITLIVPA